MAPARRGRAAVAANGILAGIGSVAGTTTVSASGQVGSGAGPLTLGGLTLSTAPC